MRVLCFEMGGIVAVVSPLDEAVRRVPVAAVRGSTHAQSSLSEDIHAVLGSLEIRRERLALVLPVPIAPDEAERLAFGLRRLECELEAVVCELRPGAVSNDPSGRDVLFMAGTELRRIPSEGEPITVANLRPAFDALYAIVRSEVRRLNQRDLVRMDVNLDQVVEAAFRCLVGNDLSDAAMGPPGGGLVIARAVFEEALQGSAAFAREQIAGVGVHPDEVFFGDEVLAMWVMLGNADGASFGDIPTRTAADLGRSVMEFLRSVPSDEPRPVYRVGTLPTEHVKQSDVSEDLAVVRPARRPGAVAIASLVASTAWAVGATVWGVTQSREVDRLQAVLANSVAPADGETARDGEPTEVALESDTDQSESAPAAPPATNAAVAQPPSHLETRRTRVGLDVVYVAPKGGVGFWIATTEVSAELYRRFSQETRRGFDGSGATPAMGVSVEGALAFCEWASNQDDRYRFRLPTSEEWSLACLAGSSGPLGRGLESSNIWKSDAFVSGSVQGAGRNAWGIVGMNGNAAEWVDTGDVWSLAGGSHNDLEDQCGCRSVAPSSAQTLAYAGFRVVAEVKQ